MTRRTAKTTPRTRTIPNRDRENIAACAALGLTFWSGHPAAGSLWATDFAGRFHQVRINRKTRQSWHVCSTTHRWPPHDQATWRRWTSLGVCPPESDPRTCDQPVRAAQWAAPESSAATLALLSVHEYEDAAA